MRVLGCEFGGREGWLRTQQLRALTTKTRQESAAVEQGEQLQLQVSSLTNEKSRLESALQQTQALAAQSQQKVARPCPDGPTSHQLAASGAPRALGGRLPAKIFEQAALPLGSEVMGSVGASARTRAGV